MSFSAIPVRSNGQRILYSWFNALRTAGTLLENFLGAAFLGETTFTIANGQAAPANVTGLLFSSATAKSAIVHVSLRRKTGSNEVISIGLLKVFYRELTSTWDIVDELGGDEDGVDFTITAGGQVQYVSDTLAGTGYSAPMTFKAITFAT